MKAASPYVGPRTFTEKERGLFFGRSREVDDLVHLLLAERIVLLYSPSGAGKSSLLQAGLIPQLKELGFETKGPLRANDLTNFPWQEISQDPHGEVLIFDQFEETVTVDPVNVEAKKSFFQQLGQALHNRGRWAVFAIREDYLAALDPYLNLIPTRLSNTFRLNLLGEKGAKDAICLPAKNAGIPFIPEAADALFDDLRTIQIQLPDGGKDTAKGDYVEPVQLQVVCDRIWRDLPENAQEIHPENIQARKDPANKDGGDAKDSLSEVDRALADFYSHTVSDVAKLPAVASKNVTERDLRDWFERHLITPQGIRTQVLKSEGLGDQVSEELDKAHIVRSETRSNREFLELAHDRLVQPLLASNKEWREKNLSPFQQEAEKWNENSERSPDRLLRGEALRQAELWAKSNALNATERDFLKASQRARKALWFRRVATAVMGVFLVTAAVFAWEFYWERHRYFNALSAGRDFAGTIVFQIDDQLEHVPNTDPIRKQLLDQAIALNEKLGVSGEGGYGAAQTEFWGQYLRGRLAQIGEKPEDATLHYQDAQKIAKRLVQDSGGNPDASHLLSLSYLALGDIDKSEGDKNEKSDEERANTLWKEAGQQYQLALPIAEKLVQLDPGNRVWRFDLCFIYKGLGDSVEDSARSREFYNHAIAESTRLTEQEPKDPKALEVRWQSLIDLGDWYENDGKDQKATIDQYLQALSVAQKLSQAKLGDNNAEHLLWVSYMMIGDAEGSLRDKRHWYQEAKKLADNRYKNARKTTENLLKRGSYDPGAKKDREDTLTALHKLDHGAGK